MAVDFWIEVKAVCLYKSHIVGVVGCIFSFLATCNWQMPVGFWCNVSRIYYLNNLIVSGLTDAPEYTNRLNQIVHPKL